MPVRVVLASRNPGKLAELRRIISGYGLELVGLDGVAPFQQVPETEATFSGNSLLKARVACRASGFAAVADDSGLAVDALNGMPGVLSARWAGRHGDDAANLSLLLAQISDVPDGRRGAAFVCAAALVTPDGAEHVVEGRVDGSLTRAPVGANGFGYDPIFVPTGESRTTAEMPADEKDAISHRGKALRALLPYLLQFGSATGGDARP